MILIVAYAIFRISGSENSLIFSRIWERCSVGILRIAWKLHENCMKIACNFVGKLHATVCFKTTTRMLRPDAFYGPAFLYMIYILLCVDYIFICIIIYRLYIVIEFLYNYIWYTYYYYYYVIYILLCIICGNTGHFGALKTISTYIGL